MDVKQNSTNSSLSSTLCIFSPCCHRQNGSSVQDWKAVSMSIYISVPFCLLCMHNLYMYICMCMLSTVGTGALSCSIIVLYSLYWIKQKWKKDNNKKMEKPTPSLRSFPNVAFVTVPRFVWLTMALSRPLKEDRLALPLSTPLSSRRSMVQCPWLCARR